MVGNRSAWETTLGEPHSHTANAEVRECGKDYT
jgi:hypothetical protein